MRLACRQLVATLAPHFVEAGEGATWQEVIKKVHPEVGFNASKASIMQTRLRRVLSRLADLALMLELVFRVALVL